MKFNAPLALPTSARVERCYAKHGKAYAHTPPVGRPLRLLLVNADRETRWAEGESQSPHSYACPSTTVGDGWRVLGWTMADGSLPLGELEAVDPTLAQYDYLMPPNYVPSVARGAATGPSLIASLSP